MSSSSSSSSSSKDNVEMQSRKSSTGSEPASSHHDDNVKTSEKKAESSSSSSSSSEDVDNMAMHIIKHEKAFITECTCCACFVFSWIIVTTLWGLVSDPFPFAQFVIPLWIFTGFGCFCCLSWFGLWIFREVKEWKEQAIWKKVLHISNLIFVIAVLWVLFIVWFGLTTHYAVRFVTLPDEGLETSYFGGAFTAGNTSSQAIYVRAPGQDIAFIEYRTVGTTNFTATSDFALNNENDHTAAVLISGLNPATQYEFRVMYREQIGGQSRSGPNSGMRTFQSFPQAGSPVNFSFGFGSCIIKTLIPEFETLSILENTAMDPQFFIFLGDFIYTDLPLFLGTEQAVFEAKYRFSVSDNNFQSVFNQMPIYFAWDDHEFINDYDDGTREATFYRNARNAWEEYAGNGNPPPPTPGMLYYSFSYGDVDFFVCDTRSFRSLNDAPDDANKTMLGAQQLADLLAFLSNSSATFKVIATTSPFSRNAGALDVWDSFNTERLSILNHIQNNNVTGVLFVSGDVHYGAAWEVTTGIFEFSNSPIYAFPAPYNLFGRQDRIERELFLFEGEDNTGVIRFDTTVSPPRIFYALFSEQDTPEITCEFTLINGRLVQDGECQGA